MHRDSKHDDPASFLREPTPAACSQGVKKEAQASIDVDRKNVDPPCFDIDLLPLFKATPVMLQVLLCRALIFCLLTAVGAPMVSAQVTSRSENRNGRDLLIIENAAALLAVDPKAGGAIVEYTDKATGHNFVAGEVKEGNTTWGWKETTRLESYHPSSDWFVSQAYQARVVDEGDGKAIVAICEQQGLRIERRMSLGPTSPELTVRIRNTNVSDKSMTIWPRWHPYMKLDDARALHSVVIAPEGPQDPGSFRKIRVGQGWDQFFLVSHGFWLATNYRTGLGLWMTFDRTDSPVMGTWTDFRFSNHPRRGYFVSEVYPRPRVVEAGGVIDQSFTYLPFAAGTDPATLSLGVLKEQDEQAAARQFLGRVLPNLAVIGPYTMQPRPSNSAESAIQQNRFNFNHLRRDRAALADWGFMDAMMAIPADQNTPMRLRYFAQAFENQANYFEVRFVLDITDALGRNVKQVTRTYPINTNSYLVVDMRDEVKIDDLPDGRYTFSLTGYYGREKTPLHIYRETRKLVGQAYAAAEKQRVAQLGQSLKDIERPVVRALRTINLSRTKAGDFAIPLMVEEASGIARTAWPVRTGVPFAQGVLPPKAALKLTDAADKDVPIQTTIQGIWPDGSSRWVLVEFNAAVPANGFSTYTLKPAGQTDANSTMPAPANIATAHQSSIAIDTGDAQYTFDEKLLDLFPADGLWWTTGAGVKYTFKIKGQNAGIVIEENGPMRAVVKVTGWYTASPASPDITRPVAMGELRFEFNRGQSWYRLNHSVTYTGEPWSEKLGSFGASFHFPGRTFKEAAIDVDGKSVTAADALSIRQMSEKLAQLTVGKAKPQTARRTEGGVKLTGDQSVNLYLHETWKLFPKQIDADPSTGVVTYHYWPAAAGPMSFVPREDTWLPSSSSPESLALGMGRTMEFVIDPQGQREAHEMASSFDEPVLAIVPPRYLTATGVIPDLTPSNPDTLPQLEQLIHETVETYRINQVVYGWYGQWAWGAVPNLFRADEKRWADYGRYAHLLNEQNVAHGLWLAYLRSGDRFYYNFAKPYSRQLMEVATIRWDDRWPDSVGLSRRHHETIWLSSGDYGHSMLDPFVEDYHITGNLAAWQAAKRMAQAMARQQTGTWRYLSNPITGLARMYSETQEPFYKQQADRLWTDLAYPDRATWFVGDHGDRMASVFGSINDQARQETIKLETAKPGTFSGMDSAAAYYRITGDPHYIATAKKRYQAIIKSLDGSQTNTDQPLRWGARTITQYNLAAVRELCYGSAVLTADQQNKKD